MRLPDSDCFRQATKDILSGAILLGQTYRTVTAFTQGALVTFARRNALHQSHWRAIGERNLLLSAANAEDGQRRILNQMKNAREGFRPVLVPGMALSAEKNM